MKIGEPGHWTSTRFPYFDVDYQVRLCLLSPVAMSACSGMMLAYLRMCLPVLSVAPETPCRAMVLRRRVAISNPRERCEDSRASFTGEAGHDHGGKSGESHRDLHCVDAAARAVPVAGAFWFSFSVCLSGVVLHVTSPGGAASCLLQSTYIPLLPSGLLDFLHSPVPFLVGCHSLESTNEWPDVCFYNIDTDTITTPESSEHINESSIPHGIEFCRLLDVARERFNALRPSSKPWHELSDEEDKIITLTMQEAEIFLRDLCFDVSSFDLTPRSGKDVLRA